MSKTLVLRALEVPKILFVGFDFLDKKILTPMRLAVAGTLLGAEKALESGEIMWNLSGGFHHVEISTVVTGGGGYSKQSASAIAAAIKACSTL